MGRQQQALRPSLRDGHSEQVGKSKGSAMVGLFNTVGHETETQTKNAAAHLFDCLALVYKMLAKVEIGDAQVANSDREIAAQQLLQVASTYEALALQGSDTPLF